MNKVSRMIKIFIAAVLVGVIVFFGVRYYLEQKAIKESNDAAIMDMIIKNSDDESKVVTLEELKDEEKINKIKEYIPNIYLSFFADKPLPEFTELKYLDDEYFLKLATLRCFEIEKEADESDVTYYTYPELNRVVVKYLGKNAHNRLPDKTTEYFEKTTAGFNIVGMCGSETKAYKYVIDKLNVGSDGLYYVDIYEYIEEYERPTVDLNEVGDRINVKVNNIKEENVSEYYVEAVPYDEASLSDLSYDMDGNEITDEDIENFVKENTNKFYKRTLAIEYDADLDLLYLKSNSLEK